MVGWDMTQVIPAERELESRCEPTTQGGLTMDSHAGQVSAETIIGELATRHPGTIAVFERLGLDYCCGGRRPIGHVVAEAGLDWPGVAAQLDEVLRSADASRDTASWAEGPLSGLLAHMLDRYHAKLRGGLRRVG